MKWTSNAKLGHEPEDGTIFKLKGIGVDISIHRVIHLTGWYLSCTELDISKKHLGDVSFEDAVKKAKETIKIKMSYLNKEFDKFLDDDSENEFSIY